jgi:hypothetical protein
MMGYNYNGIGIYDPFWDRAAWQYKFAIFPKQCSISKKTIWLKCGYKGTRMITGPGEPVFEYRWLTKEEFVVAGLKGVI